MMVDGRGRGAKRKPSSTLAATRASWDRGDDFTADLAAAAGVAAAAGAGGSTSGNVPTHFSLDEQ